VLKNECHLGDGMRPILVCVRSLRSEHQHSLRAHVQLKGEHWPEGGVKRQLTHTQND